jgi:predicted DNA-binding antitoxin AbrB/MazE fold protein
MIFKPFKLVVNEYGERVRIEFFSSYDKEKIEEKAKSFLVNFKPNAFIDEASSAHVLLR